MRFTLKSDASDATHCSKANEMASAVIVDWLGAGRTASGERWAFDHYSSRFEFVWEGCGSRLVEALRLSKDDCKFFDNPLQSFDAFVNIFACGSRAAPVVSRIKSAALLLAARTGARVRSPASSATGDCPDAILPQLKGRAIMGVTTDEKSGCTVARLMAENSEDVYRLLHFCMEPLASCLGAEPYSDRVHGAGPFEIVQTREPQAPSTRSRKPKQAEVLELNLQHQFALCHLTDSSLPVGGFAHSGGIEAALQLGLLNRREGDVDSVDGLRNFVKMLSLSALRLQGQFLRRAYQLDRRGDSKDVWQELDAELHAHLAGGLACRASLLQGAGLSRLGRRWCELDRSGHFASVFGLLCARQAG